MPMTDKYAIITAQGNAPVNKEFLSNLERYCSDNNAKILVLPTYGKNVHEEHLSPQLAKYDVIFGDYKLNNKIKIKDMKVKPQAIKPLTGLEALVKGDKSAIIAGTKINLRSVPTPNSNHAKILMTTGAITHPNYNMKHRQGRIAFEDHEYGATLVDIVDDNKYHVRYVHANKNGKFYDFDTLYDGGVSTAQQRAEAMVLGDIHCTETDPKALLATYKMIKQMQPKRLVLHDFFNGSSISHHHLNDIIELNYNYKQNGLSLEYELKENAKLLKQILRKSPKDTDIYIVASNHNEALSRYLKEGRFINEPQNVEIGCELLSAAVNGYNPLEVGINKYMNVPGRVKFLSRGDDLKVRGFYLPEHGDKGPNGSRGTPTSHSKTLEKSITGHSHTSFKYRNTIKVGTLTYLNLRYNQGGTSNWTQSNAILHPNGKAQLINIIDGKYKV